MVGINLNVLSQTEYDNARKEYVMILKEYVLPKDPTATVYEVWIFYQIKQYF